MPRFKPTASPLPFDPVSQSPLKGNGAAYGPELELWQDGVTVIGIDEAGRGPLAGPVVAAATSFDPDARLEGIGDSKVVSKKRREVLFEQIKELAVAWSIVAVDPVRIDEINILGATAEAMTLAAREVADKRGSDWPTLLVDGRIPSLATGRQLNLIKGDSRSFSIGAASILAKVYRDKLMCELDEKFPVYGFRQHKGYPTELHRRSLLQHGRCPIHRLSFTIAGLDGDRVAIGDLPLAKG
ncbi:ribonuclease HII [bacterium]|nr:ribonuclease HII [bacterium]